MHLSAENIADATSELVRATRALHDAANREADARLELDFQEVEHLTAETPLPGKNESERKAHLAKLTGAKRAELHTLERATRAARRDLELARAMLDALKYQLRLLEVTATAQN